MMTDDDIHYFLDNKTITEDQYRALVKYYFQADKTDWYKQNGDVKQWKEIKVKQFWHLIRKHHMHFCKKRKVYYFAKFVFPPFETIETFEKGKEYLNLYRSFWETEEEGKKGVFDGYVIFNKAKFLGGTRFSNVVFQGSVDLNQTIFLGLAHFLSCEFTGRISIKQTSFQDGVDFCDCQFKNNVHLFESEFLKKSVFRHSIFEAKLKVHNVLFSDRATFYESEFNEAVFKDLMGMPELDFSDQTLPKSVIFRRVNLTNTLFAQSDVAEVQFKECEWGDASRIILRDEQQEDKTIAHYAGLEEIYRQLKKNFDSNKDWESSGKAYVSEMEMRKKRLWKQKHYYHWFIYWFYDKSSGYTHSLISPIISLITLIAISSVIYYFIDYSSLWAVQRGIYGALPKLITIDIPEKLQFSGYWLLVSNIEALLGSTFLVFFILALRKRFKQ